MLWLAVWVAGLAGCSGDGGPAATDTQYTLTCPAAPTGCGSISEDTCLQPDGGAVGQREIFASNGELSCDDESVAIVICRGSESADGRLTLELEAVVGAFGFTTRVVASSDGASVDGRCQVTVIEEDLSYGGPLGACGIDPPSMEQPCQISNFTVDDESSINVSFDVECEALMSDVTTNGFDVQASIRFARCTGL